MRAVTLLALSACAQLEPEDPSGWFDEGDPYEVAEPVEFTDEPTTACPSGGRAGHRRPARGRLLVPARLRHPPRRRAEFPDHGTTCSRLDLRQRGAAGRDHRGRDRPPEASTSSPTAAGSDDEKFYGSYFLEDDTGGVFVLGDSKHRPLRHAGDTVTLRVRGTRRSFGLKT
jgi:hypothetical protein